MTAALRPYRTGTHIGESNTVERPANAMDAVTPDEWQRLCALRERYDPDRVFVDYVDGLEP